MTNKNPHSSTQDFLLYKAPGGEVKISVLLKDETIWLTQEQMAVLFDKAKSTINEHIKNIFLEGELDEKVVVRKFRITTKHGAIANKIHKIFKEKLLKNYESDFDKMTKLIEKK